VVFRRRNTAMDAVRTSLRWAHAQLRSFIAERKKRARRKEEVHHAKDEASTSSSGEPVELLAMTKAG